MKSKRNQLGLTILLLALPAAAGGQNVTVQFERLFGGAGHEIFRALTLTQDGGFVAVGHSSSFNPDPTDASDDLLVIKTDGNGIEQWRIQYGDPLVSEKPKSNASLKQTPGGDFIVVFTDENGPWGGADSGLMKISAAGTIEWVRHYGGAAYDEGSAVELTSDGGYILAGATYSPSIPGYQSHNDYYVVRTDAMGNMLWQFAFGRLAGAGTAEAAFIIQVAPGGGYLVNGLSFGHPTGGLSITIHIDDNGVKLSESIGELTVETPDGGSILASNSTAGAGGRDFYLEKRDANGTIEWTQLYGDVNDDVLYSLDLTSDNGYVLAGYFGSTPTVGAGNEDIWLIKTDSLRVVEWDLLLGQASDDAPFAIREITTDRYVVVGYVEDWLPPQGLGGRDMYLAVIEEIPAAGFITGSAFVDHDANCVRDLPLDFGLGLTLVRAVDQTSLQTYLAQTDAAGDFRFTVPPGSYTVSAVNNAIRQESCNGGGGVTYSVTVPAGGTVAGNHFGMLPGFHGACTLAGRPIPTNPPTACGGTNFVCPPGQGPATPCPGFPWMYCATFTNTGSVPLAFPSRLAIQVGTPELANCSPGTTNGVVNDTCQFQPGQSLIDRWDWNLGPNQTLAPGDTCEICVQADVIGPSPYVSTASINAFPPDPAAVLTGSGTHLPLPSPNPMNPTRVQPVYMGVGTFTGTWTLPAPAAWHGTFTGTGTRPGTPGPGIADFDFSGIGALPRGSILVIGDLDSGAGINETMTLRAFDANGVRLVEFLNEPFAVSSNVANTTPSWSWDNIARTYRFDGGSVPGNPDVVVFMKTNQDIDRLEADRQTLGFGFALNAPTGEVFHCAVTEADSCACDPNDMAVSPRGCPPTGAIQFQPLTYTIRFQNVGAGPATDVSIHVPLDADLDLETLIVQFSSHPLTNIQVGAEGELLLAYEGINLPPEISDPEGSQGSVTFRIAPRRPFVDGTEITNNAEIFFDDNPPVVTHLVTNTLYLGDPVPIAEFEVTGEGANRQFSYTGGTAGATFDWRFGEGATPPASTAQNPEVTFATPGSRAVSLTVSKAGCSSSTVDVVQVSNTCADDDGDGYGDPGDPMCLNGSARDCDDGDDQIFPGAVEVLNGIDDDCDGQIDEDFFTLEIPTLSRVGLLVVMSLLAIIALAILRLRASRPSTPRARD